MSNADTTQSKPDAKTLFWNRVQLLAIFVVFLAPIVGAFVYEPTEFNNYGDLYTPAPELKPLELRSLEGEQTTFASLKEQDLWAFLVVVQDSCSEECEQSLLNSRQIRAMQGKHLERTRSVMIYSGLSSGKAADLADKYQPIQVFEANPDELTEWRKQLDPQGVPLDKLRDRFYVVDSKGLLMISYASDANYKSVDKDLKRLLKARR